MTDEHFYRGMCPSGHEFSFVLGNMDCEVLFELAALALLDGYYGQAIMTFAAAYERFWELYLRLNAFSKDIDPDAFDVAWKDLKKNSERQRGAYAIGSLLAGHHDGLDPFPEAMSRLRNDAVHKGGLMSRKEALDFGDFVLRQMRQRLNSLTDDERKALPVIRARSAWNRSDNAAQTYTSVYRGTILNLAFARQPISTLESELAELNVWRARQYA